VYTLVVARVIFLMSLQGMVHTASLRMATHRARNQTVAEGMNEDSDLQATWPHASTRTVKVIENDYRAFAHPSAPTELPLQLGMFLFKFWAGAQHWRNNSIILGGGARLRKRGLRVYLLDSIGKNPHDSDILSFL